MKSARNAIKSGFRTACVEMTVKPAEMIDEMNNAEVVEGIALRYIELAYDFPNLYKYLYMSELDGEKMATTARALRAENQDKVMQMLKREHGISVEAAEKYLMNLQLYVHGIASFAVTKISFSSKEVIMQMIHDASEAFLEHVKK